MARTMSVQYQPTDGSFRVTFKDWGNASPESASPENPFLLPLLRQVEAAPCIAANAKSERQAQRVVRGFADWVSRALPRVRVKELRKAHVLRYFRECQSDVMLATVQSYKTILRTAFRLMAERNELDLRNPLDSIRRKELESICLTRGQTLELGMYDEGYLHRLFRWLRAQPAADAEVRLVFHLLATTGLRIGDLVTLRRRQVDTRERTLSICHHKTENTTRSHCVLHLTDETAALLAALPKRRSADGRLFRLSEISLTQKVRSTLYRYMDEVERPRGYRTFTNRGKTHRSHNIHSFRRSFITLCKKFHVEAELIRYIVGHAGSSVEEKHYNVFMTDPQGFTAAPLEMMEEILRCGKRATPAGGALARVLRELGLTREELKRLL